MGTVLYNDDGGVIFLGASDTTDEILAFHYGNFDNHYGDGTVGAAAANGRVYADTAPETLPAKFGTIETPSTASSGQTTYTWTPPSTSLQANILLVAGGGATREFCGGGGAGGVVYKANQTLNSGPYTIKVGDGGIGARLDAGNGYNTEGFGSTAIGGGGGQSSNTSSTGKSGGSGGGNGPRGATGGSGTLGQGNDGGGGRPGITGGNDGGSGGGGGASQPGTDGSYRAGGDGGAGLLVGMVGETYGDSGWFGGGGAGFGDGRNGTSTRGNPGIGGGGIAASGVNSDYSNTAGVPHTGGGAGAGGPNGPGGRDGGSGIVAIRYIVDNNVMTLLPNTGRYVRLQHTVNDRIINLREIEVYDENDVNVALNKPVTGNTPEHGSFPYSNLTDGITNTNANGGHTTGYQITGDNYDYVQIDLGSITTVSRIFIYNRTDSTTVRNRAIGIKAILIAANGTTIVKETPTITTSSATYTLTF